MTAAELPDDVAALRALLAETRAALAASEAALAERTAALARVEEARRRLELIVDELRREKFGARSEKLGSAQFNLPLEDVELAQGVLDTPPGRRPPRRGKRRAPPRGRSTGIAGASRSTCRASSA